MLEDEGLSRILGAGDIVMARWLLFIWVGIYLMV